MARNYRNQSLFILREEKIKGVTPLQRPVLPPLHACDGPSWLLCGDPVPGVSEAEPGQGDLETITLRGRTNLAWRAQSTGSSHLVTLRQWENGLWESWLSANKITLTWCSPIELCSFPLPISFTPLPWTRAGPASTPLPLLRLACKFFPSTSLF